MFLTYDEDKYLLCHMKCKELYVMKWKSHEDSPRVTNGNVKGHPTVCYK